MDGLFSGIDIGSLRIKNRIVMPPMALDIATEAGEVTPRILEHYRERSCCYPIASAISDEGRVGVGLVIVEHCYVNQEGKAHAHQLGIHHDDLLPGLIELVNTIHQGGSLAGIQISHAGARSMADPQAPTAMPLPFLLRPMLDKNGKTNLVEQPSELDIIQIKELVNDFAMAARRAKAAGFDLLEIHGAHGYLLNQFYSPLTNQRTDGYGGSFSNRLRFILEVIQAVRQEVGPDYPLFYRLGADDLQPGGTNLLQSKSAAFVLAEAGVDCLDLSGGICGYIKNGPEGFFLYMADAIRPCVDIPLLVTGGFKSAGFANHTIAEGRVDLLGVGRTLLANPRWASQAWADLSNSYSQGIIDI